LVLLVALIAAAGIRAFDIRPAVAQSQTLTVWRSAVDPGLDPESSVWDEVPSEFVQLTAQNVTPPMSNGGAPWVQVTGLHFDDVLYMNLRWVDGTPDKTTDTVGVFSDAVAVQFPAIAATSVPALCMGQADTAVNIWHWRADTQEGIALVPESGHVDVYPEVDELHYPAIAAGNPMASAPAVQNLVAGGFGTLAALDSQVIAGVGSHSDTGWSVTMARPFTPPGELQPTFWAGGIMDVAFAVWNGDNEDRNGKKSVSAFIRMAIADRTFENVGPASGSTTSPVAITVVFVGIVGLVILISFLATRRSENDDDPEQGVPVS
jgi:complex iron-sulfur molybdoenzyme family reductase subunit gamma